jgi:glycosyltransferase involved in cell wall biosynthesis
MGQHSIEASGPQSNRPLVSVIVPVYNGERFLGLTLQCIFDQDYRPFEVIVIDDGSTDRTAEVAQSFNGVRYFYQANQGPAAARNIGLQAARGELIAFLDADDLWETNKLSLQIGYHLAHPEVDYSFVKLVNFLEPGIEKPLWLRDDQLHVGQVDYSPDTLVVRKSVFDRIGGFDPAYRVGDDTDWFARAVDSGIKMGILDDVLVRRRIHGANISYESPSVRLFTLAKILKASMDRKRRKPEVGQGREDVKLK